MQFICCVLFYYSFLQAIDKVVVKVSPNQHVQVSHLIEILLVEIMFGVTAQCLG